MKICLEPGDGRPEHFKLFDEEIGCKLGLVKSVNLSVTLEGATLQFVRTNPATVVIDDEARTYDGTPMASPVLKGKHENGKFVFVD
jgi:hypothetical protein